MDISNLISETCKNCKGACCSNNEDLSEYLLDGFLTLTEKLITEPEYKSVLESRLENEILERRKFFDSGEDKNKREKSAKELLEFLKGKERFSLDDVKGIYYALFRFGESMNKRDYPFNGKDYCSFNTTHGCMIPEAKERLCRTYICTDDKNYECLAGGIYEKIPQEERTMGRFIPAITLKSGAERIIDSIMVDLVRGPKYRHAKVIFNSAGIEHDIRKAVHGIGKKACTAKSIETLWDLREGDCDIAIDKADISTEEGIKKIISYGEKFEYFGPTGFLPVVLLENRVSEIYPEKFNDGDWIILASIGFIENTG